MIKSSFFFLRKVVSLELCCRKKHVVTSPPSNLQKSFYLRGKSASRLRVTPTQTHALRIFIQAGNIQVQVFLHLNFLNFTRQERHILVQNSISNFKPQHQNRKLASRHFAAKLEPKQKNLFCTKKNVFALINIFKQAVTGKFFP